MNPSFLKSVLGNASGITDALRSRIRRRLDLAALVGASIGATIQIANMGAELLPVAVTVALALCGLLGLVGRATWTPFAYIALLVVANILYLTHYGPWLGMGVAYVVAVAITFLFLPPRWRWAVTAVLVVTPLALGGLVALDLVESPALQLEDPTARRRAALAAITAMAGIAFVVTGILRQLVTARREIENALAVEREQRAERSRLEAELARARRADLIAQLAAEVGADIGKALAIVQARAKALAAELRTDAAIEGLADVIEASTNAAATMRSLTAFAPDSTEATDERELCGDASQAARTLGKLMRRTLPARVVLSVETDADVTVPIATPDLVRILSNLVLNARDAIAETGTVAVEVRRGGTHATITVRDDGAGMPPDVLAQLFQPFFTTKPIGRGTGLGLATTRILVERAAGTIHVDSAQGRGTCFTIRLPLVSESDRRATTASTRSSSPHLLSRARPALETSA